MYSSCDFGFIFRTYWVHTYYAINGTFSVSLWCSCLVRSIKFMNCILSTKCQLNIERSMVHRHSNPFILSKINFVANRLIYIYIDVSMGQIDIRHLSGLSKKPENVHLVHSLSIHTDISQFSIGCPISILSR